MTTDIHWNEILTFRCRIFFVLFFAYFHRSRELTSVHERDRKTAASDVSIATALNCDFPSREGARFLHGLGLKSASSPPRLFHTHSIGKQVSLRERERDSPGNRDSRKCNCHREMSLGRIRNPSRDSTGLERFPGRFRKRRPRCSPEEVASRGDTFYRHPTNIRFVRRSVFRVATLVTAKTTPRVYEPFASKSLEFYAT